MSKADECLRKVLAELPPGASILDAGCGDFRLLTEMPALLAGKQYTGCDKDGKVPPLGAAFEQCDLGNSALPFGDDNYDAVILSHVLEHLTNPIGAIQELLRVLKPGGRLYVECPSDRSLKPGWWAPAHYNLILSFFDDPTHVGRPWSPQGLRRLALYFGCAPRIVAYDRSLLRWARLPLDWIYGLLARKPDHMVTSWWLATGWVSYAVIEKPADRTGVLAFDYYSFKGRPIGPRYRDR